MNMERIEQGMKLAMEIQVIKKKAVDFLKEGNSDVSSVFIMSAVSSLGKAVHEEMMKFARKTVKENPEMLDKLREEHGEEPEFDSFIQELNKDDAAAEPSASYVDFKPIE